jgi:hypothetical protein
MTNRERDELIAELDDALDALEELENYFDRRLEPDDYDYVRQELLPRIGRVKPH